MGDADLALFESLFKLKETRRAGWVRRGIHNGESVAEHTLGVVLLTMRATEQLSDLDRLKAIEMAIAHDLPEAVMGDYTPADDISSQRKRTEENLAMEYYRLLSTTNMIDMCRERLAEYNQHETFISRIVHEADKLEPLIQAAHYRKTHPDAVGLEDFKGHASCLRNQHLSAIGTAVLENWEIHKPRVRYIFLIGGPGAGKGTQCAYLARRPGIACISLGEELRKETDDVESRFRSFILQSFEEGVAVPGELAMRILRSKVTAMANDDKKLIVLDGFPRSVNQLRAFQTEVSPKFATVYLQCPSDILEQRLQARALSSNRIDDLDAKRRALRARTYEAESTALLGELRKAPFTEVDGSDPTEEVARVVGRCVQEV
ncbi:hypothetical protein F4808DRAFT_70648 [Astrocystis sublimbata]|nr:hypothetical protein F4808DRAFT_70648 [Astrocystis sublimbata]